MKNIVGLAIFATFSCRWRVSSSLAAYGTLYKSQSLTQKRFDWLQKSRRKVSRKCIKCRYFEIITVFLSCRLYFEEFFVYLVDDLGLWVNGGANDDWIVCLKDWNRNGHLQPGRREYTAVLLFSSFGCFESWLFWTLAVLNLGCSEPVLFQLL
jgi:hypothetical protein